MAKFILFDMDGVLLKPLGYQKALISSVERIGKALGAPHTRLTADQIAAFEALGITNEWDSVAICTALLLIEVWQEDPSIRLQGLNARPGMIHTKPPDFDTFIKSFANVTEPPGESAFLKIITENPWLTGSQRDHLHEILFHCRDIYHSLTLPGHVETVLGSQAFKPQYSLEPQLSTDSFLLIYDQPILSSQQQIELHRWLENDQHFAGIMTNRPSKAPDGFLSAPEAEIGIEVIGFGGLPYLGSGLLGWFSSHHCKLPSFTFQKPNPVHALGLLRMMMGEPPEYALKSAADLWLGRSNHKNWGFLENGQVVIFEDSAKGLNAGKAAQALLKTVEIDINLILIGVSQNPIKIKALQGSADRIIPRFSHQSWDDYFIDVGPV